MRALHTAARDIMRDDVAAWFVWITVVVFLLVSVVATGAV